MDKRWYWTRLPGWLEVRDWQDIASTNDPPPPKDSLLLAKPGVMAMLAAMPTNWRAHLQPREMIEMMMRNLEDSNSVVGPIEENDDGSCSFSWTSADGLNSGRTMIRVPDDDPETVFVISAIWPVDHDDLGVEFDIIASSLRRA